MKFYRATAEGHDLLSGYTTIPGELVTEKKRNTKFRYLTDYFFIPVEVSKKNTYWSFGARFECGTTYKDFTSHTMYREVSGKIKEV